MLQGVLYVADPGDPVERDECYNAPCMWLALAILQNGTSVTRRLVRGYGTSVTRRFVRGWP
jgi:hypothetical protein